MEKDQRRMYEAFMYMNEESIDPELICSICQTPFDDPCCTTCDETYCCKCITRWIQTGNGSCPHCRQTLSINTLRPIPRPLKSILDQLKVKCILCGQTELERGNFANHINKICPKVVVSCPSADIQCSWTGQRDQLKQHLADCQFEGMRPVITQLTTKNRELKMQLTQYFIQINIQQNEIKQIKEQVNQNKTQIDAQQNKNQQLEYRINDQINQIAEQQNNIKQLTEQVDQQKIEIDYHQIANQQLKYQVIRLRKEITGKQNKEQVNQQQVAINEHQNLFQRFGKRLRQKLFD